MTQPLPSGGQAPPGPMPVRRARAVSGSATPARGRAPLSATGTARRGGDAGDFLRPALSDTARRPWEPPGPPPMQECGWGCCRQRRRRCPVTRRQRRDLELLLIIRRAERHARLLGGSPFNQPDAVSVGHSTQPVTLTDVAGGAGAGIGGVPEPGR